MTDHPFFKDWLSWSGSSAHRSHHRPSDQGVVIKYSNRVLVAGALGLGGWLAMAFRSQLSPRGVESPSLTLVFLACACLHGMLIFKYWRVRYRLEPDGLHYFTLLGRNQSLLWKDVARIRYSTWRRLFVIEAERGGAVVVSTAMTPLIDFSCAVLRCVPRGRMDAKTFRFLKSTAAGLVPHMWQ